MSATFRETGTFESADIKYPLVDGTAGQVVTTDGAGNLSFSGAVTGGTAQLVLAAAAPFDMSTTIPVALGVGTMIRINAIGRLTSGSNAGEAITFVVNASYRNDGGLVARVGINDDVLVNKDNNIVRTPGANMDVVTTPSGSDIVIGVYSDAAESTVFDLQWYLTSTP